MKRKSFVKVVTLIIIFTIIILMGKTTEVNAALQATTSTQYTKTDDVNNWMKNFRNMEKTGEAMGLDEKLNADLTSETSNNIDVHMMRSTEYGAIAILSASGYGNSKKIQESEIKSTTGNETGVIIDINCREWVAGGINGQIFSGVNKKYYDEYTESNNSARVGDALGNASTTNPGCTGWHSAIEQRWVDNRCPYFARGIGGIFAYIKNYFMTNLFYARGVAVVGDGF